MDEEDSGIRGRINQFLLVLHGLDPELVQIMLQQVKIAKKSKSMWYIALLGFEYDETTVYFLVLSPISLWSTRMGFYYYENK